MAAGRYEISILVLKKNYGFRFLVKYFSTIEENFRISARPCDILHFFCFRGHGNESCNLIGSLLGQYFPEFAHRPR